MNHTPIKLLFFALISLIPQLCRGSIETILHPVEVTIRAQAEAPLGEVVVTIHAKGSGTDRKISSITLKVNGKSVPVPEKAYTDLTSPLLNSVELRTEDGKDGSPWLYIFFLVEHRTSDGELHPKQVRIHYHAGRIEARSINTPNSEGGSSWKENKL